MKYKETQFIINKLYKGVDDIFSMGDFKVMEISSFQIHENKKGIITLMPVIKIKRNEKNTE